MGHAPGLPPGPEAGGPGNHRRDDAAGHGRPRSNWGAGGAARRQARLAVLGSQGLVGRDLAADAWFRRDLPFAEALIPKLAPRVGRAATITRADVEIRELPAGGHEVFRTKRRHRTPCGSRRRLGELYLPVAHA